MDQELLWIMREIGWTLNLPHPEVSLRYPGPTDYNLRSAGPEDRTRNSGAGSQIPKGLAARHRPLQTSVEWGHSWAPPSRGWAALPAPGTLNAQCAFLSRDRLIHAIGPACRQFQHTAEGSRRQKKNSYAWQMVLQNMQGWGGGCVNRRPIRDTLYQGTCDQIRQCSNTGVCCLDRSQLCQPAVNFCLGECITGFTMCLGINGNFFFYKVLGSQF